MSIKIGIVEDEMIIAASLADTLEQLGYSATEPVASFTEAMQMIEKEKPDIILIDIMLVGQYDGIDLAREIRNNYAIPFIFLTASTDPLTFKRAMAVHPAAYLFKPFTREGLFNSIEICLGNFVKPAHRKK